MKQPLISRRIFHRNLNGSRDWFLPQTFWDTCHDIAGTVMIANFKEAEEIFGGYNPPAWNYNMFDVSRIRNLFHFSLKQALFKINS